VIDKVKKTDEFAAELDKRYPGVKGSVTETVAAYILFGRPMGDFMVAVICNDLFGAMARADLENRLALHEICQIVYNHVPLAARGDRSAYERWVATGGQHGIDARDHGA
jgi:hypothetical protein